MTNTIHRVGPDGRVTTFAVEDGSHGLSVNSAGNLLVPFVLKKSNKIVEYTTLGQQVREITLPAKIVNATHVVELSSGQLAVCQRSVDAPFHRVCMLSGNGSLVKCYPRNGTSFGQLDYPIRLATAKGQLLVDDIISPQILLLNGNLVYQYDVIERYGGLRYATRMHYDEQTSKLYVADNDFKAGEAISETSKSSQSICSQQSVTNSITLENGGTVYLWPLILFNQA